MALTFVFFLWAIIITTFIQVFAFWATFELFLVAQNPKDLAFTLRTISELQAPVLGSRPGQWFLTICSLRANSKKPSSPKRTYREVNISFLILQAKEQETTACKIETVIKRIPGELMADHTDIKISAIE